MSFEQDTTGVAEPSLAQALGVFRDKVNAQPRIKTLLKGWNRLVHVQPAERDQDVAYTLRFTNCEITEILPGRVDEGGETIHLRASEATLREAFLGRRNPATLFLEGELEVFASDRDQTKLDAIALIIWAD